MLIIDCHAHIYSPDEQRYPPKDKPLRVPGGKASIDDLRRTSLANGVAAVREGSKGTQIFSKTLVLETIRGPVTAVYPRS